MEDFPGNSRRPGPRPQPPTSIESDSAEEVRLEQVVTGKVLKRKKPIGRRLKEMFFSGDSNSVVGYLGKEVLLPALQNLITDFVTQGIEKAVYGEVRTVGRTHRGSSVTTTRPGTHISYDRPGSIRPMAAPAARRAVMQPSAFDVGEIILDSQIDAQVAVDKLYETVEKYGAATVAHLNDLIGQTSVYTDHKWGWTDLTNMTVKRVREGYLLILPEPEDLRQ